MAHQAGAYPGFRSMQWGHVKFACKVFFLFSDSLFYFYWFDLPLDRAKINLLRPTGS